MNTVDVADVAGLIRALAGHGLCVVPIGGVMMPSTVPASPASIQAARPTLPPSAPTVQVAVQLVMEHKTKANLRPCYVTSLDQYLGTFAAKHGKRSIADITAEDLETWFTERQEPPGTRASNLGRLGALFSFAKRRGWITANPVDRVERIKIDRKPPSILTPVQAETALRGIRAHWPKTLPHVVLAMLAGIRPAELGKITWADVKLDQGIVTVSAAASKVRCRRIVHLMPSTVEWLKLGGQLPLSAQTRRRVNRRISRLLGLDRWPQDLMRHTAASYLLAHHESPGKVSMILGNSEGILRAHYMELVSKEDCARFWAIRP